MICKWTYAHICHLQMPVYISVEARRGQQLSKSFIICLIPFRHWTWSETGSQQVPMSAFLCFLKHMDHGSASGHAQPFMLFLTYELRSSQFHSGSHTGWNISPGTMCYNAKISVFLKVLYCIVWVYYLGCHIWIYVWIPWKYPWKQEESIRSLGLELQEAVSHLIGAMI